MGIESNWMLVCGSTSRQFFAGTSVPVIFESSGCGLARTKPARAKHLAGYTVNETLLLSSVGLSSRSVCRIARDWSLS